MGKRFITPFFSFFEDVFYVIEKKFFFFLFFENVFFVIEKKMTRSRHSRYNANKRARKVYF